MTDEQGIEKPEAVDPASRQEIEFGVRFAQDLYQRVAVQGATAVAVKHEDIDRVRATFEEMFFYNGIAYDEQHEKAVSATGTFLEDLWARSFLADLPAEVPMMPAQVENLRESFAVLAEHVWGQEHFMFVLRNPALMDIKEQ